MKAIILDDELYCSEALFHLIQKYCPQISMVSMYTDPELALEEIRKETPDILFLDVEMPFLSGFDFVHKVGPTSISIIFTTAYDTYAVQAFKVNAVDYLLKPIDKEELIAAVLKVAQKPQPMDQALISGLIRSALEEQTPKKITIHTLDGIHLLPLSEILYCRSEGSYCHIYIRDKGSMMVSKNLAEMEELIKSSKFFRVHKSHLINQEHIVKINKSEGGDVTMSNSDRIPIARQRRSEFFEWLSS